MLTHKTPRTKGKFSFTNYFQKLREGDSVAVVKELSFPFAYSNRLQGKTGKVIRKRGSAYEVEIKDLNMVKRYLIKPIHLKKIQETKRVKVK